MVEFHVQMAINELKQIPCQCKYYIKGKCKKCDIIEELTKIRIKVHEFEPKRRF